MKHGCQIRGNNIADEMAGAASLARTAAIHKEFTYATHRRVLREVISFVGGIERLFPTDGPSPRARDVARSAKPGGAKRRRNATYVVVPTN